MTNRGFGSVAMLALIPFLMTFGVASGSIYLLFRSDAKYRHHCRTKLLQSQERVARHLAELIALNPQAQALRMEREFAELDVSLAMDPPTQAAAQAKLNIVIQKQIRFAAKQQMLIMKAKLESRSGPAQASVSLSQAAASDIKRRTSARLSPTSQGGAFDVRAKQVNSLSPDYEPALTFTKSQTMRVRWRIGLSALLPTWVDTWIPLTGLGLAAECSATLAQPAGLPKEQKWRPILNAANP